VQCRLQRICAYLKNRNPPKSKINTTTAIIIYIVVFDPDDPELVWLEGSATPAVPLGTSVIPVAPVTVGPVTPDADTVPEVGATMFKTPGAGAAGFKTPGAGAGAAGKLQAVLTEEFVISAPAII
jgi:hypothetical protein